MSSAAGTVRQANLVESYEAELVDGWRAERRCGEPRSRGSRRWFPSALRHVICSLGQRAADSLAHSRADDHEYGVLEDRLLLSGVPLTDLAAGENLPELQETDLDFALDARRLEGSTESYMPESPHQDFSGAPLQLQAAEALFAESRPNETAEIVFVDSTAADYEYLIDDIRQQTRDGRDIDVYLLDSRSSGMEQIAEVLSGYSALDAIHLVSHGSDGTLRLGATNLNFGNLDEYSDTIAGWNKALRNGADLLIYGCDLAASDQGRALTQALGQLCDCDVAASVDDTGNAQLGGDWDLEYQVGQIESNVALTTEAQQDWSGLLDLNPKPEFVVNDQTADVQETSGEDRGSHGAVAADNNGNYVVVWTSQNQAAAGADIYAQRFDTSGMALTAEILVNQTTANDQRWGRVASDDLGNFVVTWTSDQGGSNDVYVRLFDSSGSAQTNEILVNSTVNGEQRDSSIAMDADDGAFVVTWEGNGEEPGQVDDEGIFYRRFDAAGGALDVTEVLVNFDNTTGTQQNAAIDANRAGNFVIVWDDIDGLFARQFDAGGAAQGNRITVDISSEASRGAVAMDAGGNFVATWRDIPAVTSDGVLARMYDAAGMPQGASFIVFDQLFSDQTNPSIDMDTAGNFAVAWEGAGPGDIAGVFVKTYDAAGTVLGSETLVNQTTANVQSQTSVAMIDAKNYVVVWSGEGTGDADGVFARQFGTDLPLPQLLLATKGPASAGGTSPLTWNNNEVISFGDPNLALGTPTSGTFASLLGFNPAEEIRALHYVNSTMTVGTTGAQMPQMPGDLLVTFNQDGQTYGGVPADRTDVLLYRPGAGFDYANGTYSMLLDDPIDDGGVKNVHAFTLVEQDTVVGNTTVTAGTFLIARSGGSEHMNVYTYTPKSVGAGTTTQSTGDLLLDGTKLNITSSQIQGLELVEDPLTLGSVGLAEGTLLVSVDDPATINPLGENLTFQPQDIFALQVTATEQDPLPDTVAISSMLVDGSDVSLDDANDDEQISGLTLVQTISPANSAPVANDGEVSVNEDDTYVFSIADFGYGDVNGDPLDHIRVRTLESAGFLQHSGTDVLLNQTITAADIAAGLLTFDPAPEASGTSYAQFSFDVNDGMLYSSASYTMTVDVTPQNDPPTLTFFATPVDTTLEDTELEITFAELQAQGDEADVDGTVSAFVIQTVLTGTLRIGTDAASATLFVAGTNDAIDSTRRAYWTPDPDMAGLHNAFQVVARDNMGAVSIGNPVVQIGVTAQNDPPAISNLAGDNLLYSEGAGPLVIEQGSDTTVSDVDSTDFDGGSVTIAITAGGVSAEDVLSIRNVGTAPGEIGFSGSTVTFGGTVFGTTIGGTNGSDLIVSLNGNATPAIAAELLHHVTYENTDAVNPISGTRTLRFVVEDGDGGTSIGHDATVSVTTTNNAPAISNLDGDTLVYTEGQGQRVVEQGGDALVADPDSSDFDTGTLSVSIAAGAFPGEDLLGIRNQGAGTGEIGVVGSNITYNAGTSAVVIGSFTIGPGGTSLTATFNNQSGAASVGALINNISYENLDTANPAAGTRTARFVLTDGDGGTSTSEDAFVTVTASNEPPTDLVLSNDSIPELTDTGGGVSIGTLIATDEDVPEAVVFNVVGGPDVGAFSIGGASFNELVLQDGVLDFENKSSYQVLVRVTDSAANTLDRLLTVHVINVNESPSITQIGHQVIPEDGTTAPLAFTIADPDTPTGSLLVAATSDNQALVPNANISLAGAGTNRFITITPAADLSGGPVTVTVTVNDGFVQASTMFQITVTSANDAPDVAGDTFVTSANNPLVVSAPGVLANDTDRDGTPLAATLLAAPAHGTVTLFPDGSFTYEPDTGFAGTDQFQYQATDGTDISNPVTVLITVAAPATLPDNQPDADSEDSTGEEEEKNDNSGLAPLSTSAGNGTGELNRFARRGTRPHLENRTETQTTGVYVESKPVPSESESVALARRPSSYTRQTRSLSEDIAGIQSQTTTTSLISLVDAGALLQELDDLEYAIKAGDTFETMMVGTVAGLSTSLSVGYVVWILRGGYLLTSLLAQMPAWQLIDPLPVLNVMAGDQDDDEEDDDESLESIVGRESPPAYAQESEKEAAQT